MENPFIITGYIKPEYFCDREKEAERIISKVTKVSHPYKIGLFQI